IDLLNPLTSAVEVRLNAINALRSQREKEAIECAEEAAFEDKGNIVNSTVIIVYGSTHDFKPYCDEYDHVYERIECSERQYDDKHQPKKRNWKPLIVAGTLADFILIGAGASLYFSGIITPLMLGAAVATLTLPGAILVGIAALVLVFSVGALIDWLTRDNKTSADLPPPSTAHHNTNAYHKISPATRLVQRTAELTIIAEDKRRAKDEQVKKEQKAAKSYEWFMRPRNVQPIEVIDPSVFLHSDSDDDPICAKGPN
ncbi:MAG: hypothetical protein B7X00_00240, partial [Legionella sp. 21-45-4]